MPAWRFTKTSRDKAGTSDKPSEPAASGSAFPSGIKILHGHEASTVDIVFIHGLTGDREKTWTAEGAAAPWPQTLLPAEFPIARILTYGYDAGVTDWKGVVSQSRIANHAWNLLTSLASYRDDNASKPIIFVCHSLGGLVCENALVIARQRKEPHLLNILHSTRGIAFLGTPHHGSGLAQWAEKISRYISVLKQANSNIVAILRRDSEVLASIQDGFHTMVQARTEDKLPPIEITCFYEELPLAALGLVVPQDSAILPGYIPIGIRSNHMNMCRFLTTDDPGFISVCGELRRWVRKTAATQERLENSCIPNSVGESQSRDGGHQSPAPHILMPYTSNPGFVGRTKILDQLCQEQPKMDSKFQIRVAIYGLGGVGKTQIAIEYVFRLCRECPDMSVFWVHASTTERFHQAYDSIAQECQIPGHSDPKSDVLLLVKRWLESKDRGRWLLVIDNADDTQIFHQSVESTARGITNAAGNQGGLSRYIPECTHGAILITTRNKKVGSLLTRGRRLIEISKMDDDESGDLLRRRLGDGDAKSMSLLASGLEHLPLALVQAASFMQENTISAEDYLRLLDDNDQHLVSLLSEDFEAEGRDSGMPHAVAATWILTFEQVKEQNALAGELLSFMCLLDRQAIPYEFLSGLAHLEENQQDDEELQLTKALGMLKAFSLVIEEKNNNFNMHRLVQLVTRKWLALKEISGQVEKKALLVISDKYPDGDFEHREICSAYLPHAQAVLRLNGTKSREEDLARARILHNLARFHDFKGQWGDSMQCYKQARGIQAAVMGPNHPDTLAIMSNLALTYSKQGRWKEAESLNLQVIEAEKMVLGSDHPSTLTSMANLALTYSKQRRLEEAESLNLQVMEARKMVLGSDHPDTLTSMTNLASTYSDQGRWKEAESLELQVMEMKKRVLGLYHPSTLTSMTNLASTYSEQRRWKEAESLELQVMEMKKRVLGLYHPSTLTSMTNLASTYSDQRRWKEAESLELQVMEMKKRVLGLYHPSTLTSMTNLASTYSGRGRWKEAESLELQVMEINKTVLGSDHPDTLTHMSNLAMIYNYQGRWKEAESLEVQALETEKRVLGPDHYDTLTSMNNLAFTWNHQGRHRDAFDLMNQCYQARLRVQGFEHPYTKSSLLKLQTWSIQNPDLENVVEGQS